MSSSVQPLRSSKSFIKRLPWGKGFTYRNAGKTVDDNTRSWIKSLVIPPAWQDVLISTDPQAKVLATGRDAKGRKQYIYNESFRAQQEAKKFERITDFADRLPHMRSTTSRYLKEPGFNRAKVLSCMVRLIDHAYFRPGSPKYTEENHSYGLTTLRSKHLEISGNKIEFEYQGKSGIEQSKVIEDRRLAEIVRSLDEIPGYEIFKYFDESGQKVYVNADDLNSFIRQIMGQEYSAKDFRTWAGTYLAAVLLNQFGIQNSNKLQEKLIVRAVDQVAEKLGNTRAIARSNYIDPCIISEYQNGRTIGPYINELKREVSSKDNLTSSEEKAVLKMLNQAKEMVDRKAAG